MVVSVATVDEGPVRILLKCFLVTFYFGTKFYAEKPTIPLFVSCFSCLRRIHRPMTDPGSSRRVASTAGEGVTKLLFGNTFAENSRK